LSMTTSSGSSKLTPKISSSAMRNPEVLVGGERDGHDTGTETQQHLQTLSARSCSAATQTPQSRTGQAANAADQTVPLGCKDHHRWGIAQRYGLICSDSRTGYRRSVGPDGATPVGSPRSVSGQLRMIGFVSAAI